ncbi:hypothetical protein BG006_004895 [Podila minutissima]|uniref:RRM domain-containing protein n=1 Tax=Podila minutissima TaxID=64525 RepID=A0A9P5SNP2_9FUNG|nr:hypothetical protein BG006_004895 [Podila minutissima]
MAPPGTFVTGTHWDKPAQTKPLPVVSAAPTKLGIGNTPPTASTTTPNPKASARIWDSLKDQISSELAPESPSNTELNKKKLEAISKVTHRKQAYSPYLLISQLPHTVMPDDIRRLAVNEDSITDIIFHRNAFMEFQGKVTVVFRSATDAVEFITQRYGKFLSGHKLSMNMPLSGHMVLVSGLPAASRPDHLRTEFRRFQLMDTTEAAIIPVPSHRMASSCQYLIRLSSRSEAFRFVRTYHNTFFQYKEFRRRCPIRATIIY